MTEDELQKVGVVKHYYPKIGVAVIEVTDTLAVGDTIKIKGTTTDFEQKIQSMEIEHGKVERAKRGDDIGLKVEKRVRERDIVFKKSSVH